MRFSSSIMSSTAIAAAQDTGLPPVVTQCAPGSQSIISAFVIVTLRGMHPPPIALAMVITSGIMPSCSTAHIFPVLPTPVWISSAIMSKPYLSESFLNRWRYPSGGGIYPNSPKIGSTTKPTVSSGEMYLLRTHSSMKSTHQKLHSGKVILNTHL